VTVKQLLHLDPQRCDGCGDCVTACAALGHPARLRVRSSAANPGANGALACCRHCERPLCAAVCPTACLQVGSNGVVLPRPERCVGCRLCLVACPLGGMVFDAQGKAGKCDLCLELGRRGHPPACVASCAKGALQLVDLGNQSALQRRALAEHRGAHLKHHLGGGPSRAGGA
jgi:Fe-S-cluster-containing dehydrogenase component